MRHEGYSYEVNVFDRNMICTDEGDLWSANCVIPNLLFDDLSRFSAYVNGFKVEHTSFSEFLTFLNSGGVIAKTKHIPFPLLMLKILWHFDNMLCRTAPSVFALQRQIVMIKKTQIG
jgi:hypothetical protein